MSYSSIYYYIERQWLELSKSAAKIFNISNDIDIVKFILIPIQRTNKIPPYEIVMSAYSITNKRRLYLHHADR